MKQSIHRFAGGLTGALVLASVYVLVLIAISYVPMLLPYSGSSIQKFADMDKWTFDGIEEGFYAAAIFGFISGVGFPQKIRKWFPPIILGIPIILLLFGCFLYNFLKVFRFRAK